MKTISFDREERRKNNCGDRFSLLAINAGYYFQKMINFYLESFALNVTALILFLQVHIKWIMLSQYFQEQIDSIVTIIRCKKIQFLEKFKLKDLSFPQKGRSALILLCALTVQYPFTPEIYSAFL